MRHLAAIGLFALAACGAVGESDQTATLYRNSPIDPGMRVLFASFDAPEKGDYNLSNCGMAARALNANVKALAETEKRNYDPSLGFWCEPGSYDEDGRVPVLMQAEFPTDSTGAKRW